MKTTKRQGVADASDATTQRLNVRVTTEAYERLLVHALKARKSPGELITELIEIHLRQWRVQTNQVNRAASVAVHDRLVPSEEINLDAAVAA